MQVSLRMDYATLNFADGQMNCQIIKDVFSPDYSLDFQQFGFSENSPWISPLGLRFLNNSGFMDRPHSLQISGVGCTHFLNLFPALVSGKDYHCSRVDFAFDVFMRKTDWSAFLSRCIQSSMDSGAQRKKFFLQGSGDAWTVYAGSRRTKYLRIYNKSLESPDYRISDPETGDNLETPDGFYIIRYEIQYMRFCCVRSGVRQLYDPTPLFEDYFGSGSEVFSFVRDTWKSYSHDVLLPDNFSDIEFVLWFPNKTKNFVQFGGDCELQQVLPEIARGPYSFDHTLEYIATRLGAYIPFMLNNKRLLDICKGRARDKFGFFMPFEVIFKDGSELDFDDLSADVPVPFDNSPVAEQVELYNINQYDRSVYFE